MLVPLHVEIRVDLAEPLVTADPWVELQLLTPTNVQGGEGSLEALQHLLGVVGSSHSHGVLLFKQQSPQKKVHYHLLHKLFGCSHRLVIWSSESIWARGVEVGW